MSTLKVMLIGERIRSLESKVPHSSLAFLCMGNKLREKYEHYVDGRYEDDVLRYW